MFKIAQFKIHQNDLALVLVALGILITLAQMYGLYIIFDDQYIEARAVINSMSIAAPLLCFGFDTSAPIITKREKTPAFLWNFFGLHLIFMGGFITAAFVVDEVKTSYIFLGLALGAVFASKLFIVEYERCLGKIKQYYFDLHVRDRLYRTIAILLLALFFSNITTWSIAFLIFSLAYFFLLVTKYWNTVTFDRTKLTHHLSISLPYLATGIVTAVLYRLAFYVSYYQDNSMDTAKVDFWLMVSLFLLIPYLNASKIAETAAKNSVTHYIDLMRASWEKISLQQSLIILLIMLITVGGYFIGRVDKPDIVEIILPILLAIIIATSTPSFCYLALLAKKIKLAFVTSALLIFFSLLCYAPKYFFASPIPVSYLMLVNACGYAFFNIIASYYFLGLLGKFTIRTFSQSTAFFIFSVTLLSVGLTFII